MATPIPVPAAPVEPDIAATPVQVRIDPVDVFAGGATVPDKDIHWAVPPNTLVFRGVPRVLAPTGTAHKRRLTVPDPVAVAAFYPDDVMVIPFGVSIDGCPSAADARRWPRERGQIAVSVSGTVTMLAHMDDIKDLEVGDRLCIKGGHDGVHTAGIEGYPGLHVPRISKMDGEVRQTLRELDEAMRDTDDEEQRRVYAQEYKAQDYFGIVLELGYAELRVLLTP